MFFDTTGVVGFLLGTAIGVAGLSLCATGVAGLFLIANGLVGFFLIATVVLGFFFGAAAADLRLGCFLLPLE